MDGFEDVVFCENSKPSYCIQIWFDDGAQNLESLVLDLIYSRTFSLLLRIL
jgi:hypothetical protein